MEKDYTKIYKSHPIGFKYDGSKIKAVLYSDPQDSFQTYFYLLENGEQVWIPNSSVSE